MRSRIRKVLFGMAVLVALAVVLPYGLYTYNTRQAKTELSDFLFELDRTAQPWRLKDLEDRRAVLPDAENSAIVINKVRLPTGANSHPPFDDLKLQPNQLLEPMQLVQLRQYLDLVDDKIKEARGLTALPRGRFYVRIAPDVISTLIPHVQEVRELGNGLQHDGWFQMHQANFDEAAQTIHATINVSRSLRDELFIISHMVRLVVLNMAARSTERMLGQGQPPAHLLPPLQKLLLEEADYDAWSLAIRGERAGMHQLFEFIESGKVDMRMIRGLLGAREQGWRNVITDRFIGVNSHQAHVWTLRYLTDVLALAELPVKERPARAKELTDSIGKAPELSQIFAAPVWKNCSPFFERTKAKLRCSSTGLAAELFRQKHDRWPKNLEELTPEFLPKVQLDPYTEEPLKLAATPDGIVIYSPGPEGTMHGAAQEKRDDAEFETLAAHEFRLWNVDQRRRPK